MIRSPFFMTTSFQRRATKSLYLNSSHRGFTIIELIVSIGIMTMITGLVLANYKTFSNSAQFVNAAESIVLGLRQAQVYGIASKGSAVPCGAVSVFDCVYGIHLDKSQPNQAILFVDEDVAGNGAYHYTASDRIIETIAWNPQISITGLSCNGVVGGVGGVCSGETMDITFRRPNADAIIADQLPVDVSNPLNPVSNASGVITLTNGVRTAVATTTSTGQISLQYYD